MALGGTTRSIAQTRTIRAQAGKSQNAQLSLLALDVSPKTPIINLASSPSVHPLPITGGDGVAVDESTATSPWVDDDPDLLVIEGITETGGLPPGS